MQIKALNLAVGVLSLLMLGSASGAQAQDRSSVHFSGSIHDYTSSTVTGGPWEMHGAWTLDVHVASRKADFSIDMTMSDYGTTSTGAIDPTKPGNTAHVHHIVLKDATVQANMDGCPAFAAPTNNTFGFQFTGKVSLLTGNGQPAPFDPAPPQSPLTVCVTGVPGEAGAVTFSNITMVLGAPATKHFGVGTVIHGVVTNADPLGQEWWEDRR
ncbi:MAG TPA: hypothetical protein VGI45_17820 [Terracidiphilus sp.]|jgi:hypothetical protein